MTNTRRAKGLLLTFSALGLFLALSYYRQRSHIPTARTAEEILPPLLTDSEDGNPSRALPAHFDGGPEANLLKWLKANLFTIDVRARTASRKVLDDPRCKEIAYVAWTAANGIVRNSSAIIREEPNCT